MSVLSLILNRCIEVISVSLLVILAVIVVMAVVFRYILNDSLPWYDELASVLLAWITYFGAALAAQKRAHMGFGALLLLMPVNMRYAAFAVAEFIFYAVFITLAWAGWRVLAVTEGMSLESLPWMPLSVIQGIVPVGCALIVLAQLVSTPHAVSRLREGLDADAEEITHEIARAQADIARHEKKG